MDIQEQNKLGTQIEKSVVKHLKGKEFHIIIAVEDQGNGFAFSVSSLKERTSFQSCNLIVNGVFEETINLVENFRNPSDKKFNKPVELK